MYTVKEASEKLGLSPGRIRRLLRKDELKGEKLGRDWVVLSLEYNVHSVKEAAVKLGLGSSQVRRLLASGKIKGTKLARDWVVLSLDYQRRRKPVNRHKISNN
jgi:excisionase family DNA binding protein